MNRQQNLNHLAQRLKRLARHQSKLKSRLENTFALRLFCGTVFFVLLVLVAMDIWVETLVIAEAAILLVFGFGVYLSRRLHHAISQTDRLMELYTRISHRLQFESQDVALLPENESWIHHPLAQDLDLVGSHSLLNMMDETVHSEGQLRLIQDLVEAKFSREQVLQRQGQIEALSRRAGLIRKYKRITREALMQNSFGLSTLLRDSFVFEGFKNQHLRLWVLCLAFWIALFVEAFAKINTHYALIWTIYFLYMIYSLRKVESAFSRLQDIILRFESLLPTFKVIERFVGVKELKPNLTEFTNSPTQAIRRFETGFAFLSVQSHPVFLFLINGLVPWTYFFVGRAEKERIKLSGRTTALFNEFASFDALASLGLFRRYLTSVFPSFTDEFVMEKARHPLISTRKNIPNTFQWPKAKNLILVTGSNMAGKSTFLRTLGLNFVLARTGAPVFADRFSCPLIPIKTCIRVSDSVREGFSYFYAETLRVSEILKIAKSQRILFLIDEVFKGTNNRERFVGGKSLIEALSKTSAQGFVTTHDLELSKLNLTSMANYHFKDEIRDSEMHFSYKIEEGPCPTTNALKIMSLAGIPIAEQEKR